MDKDILIAQCPNCKSFAFKVKHTYDKGTFIMRYKKCLACGKIINTFEVPKELFAQLGLKEVRWKDDY